MYKWYKNTYCELDLKKYNVSSEEEQSKMLFNSIKSGLLLISDFDHLNKEKINKALKHVEENGLLDSELPLMSRSKDNITASIVFKVKKPGQNKTTYYLLLRDTTKNRIGKVKIDDISHWWAPYSFGQLKIKKETIEIIGRKSLKAESYRKSAHLPDSYIFDIDKILKN